MKKLPKAFELFNSLSKNDIKDVLKMADSPFFTSNSKLKELLNFLKKGKFKSQRNLDFKKEVFVKIFPNEVYNDLKIRKLFTELSNLINQFFLHNHYQENKEIQDRILLESYQKRNLQTEYIKLEKQILNNPKTDIFSTPKDLISRIQVNRVRLNWLLADKIEERYRTLNEVKNDTYNYNQLSQLMIDTESIYNKDLVPSFKRPKSKPTQTLILSEFYKGIKGLLNNFKLEDFQNLFSNYEKYFDELPTDYRIELYQYFRNIIIRQDYRNAEKFGEKVLELYQFGIERKLLIINNQINLTNFINILAFSYRLRKDDFAEDFIVKYQSYLHEKEREEAIVMGKGFKLFYNERYDESYKLLINIKVTSKIHKLTSKILMLRCLYFLGLYDTGYRSILKNRIDSERRWMNDNKDHKKLKSFDGYLKTTKQLIGYQESINRSLNKFERIKREIFNPKNLLIRLSLSEKIEETLKAFPPLSD